MKKMRVFVLLIMVFLLCGALPAYASLTVIGKVNYQGDNYNLIYMPDGPFGPVTWLDYTNITGEGYTAGDTWDNQVAWAAGLGSQLGTITPAKGYEHIISMDWTGWRLPITTGTTTGEMGTLYNDPEKTLFTKLLPNSYWSGTEYSEKNAWYFFFGSGEQWYGPKAKDYETSYNPYSPYRGLAVQEGIVSAVPLPGAFLLLGSGLAGLVSCRNILRRRLR